MGASDFVRDVIAEIKPEPHETVESLASRMYCTQMEVYRSLAMSSFPYESFDALTQEIKDGWLEAARKKFKQ